MGQLQLIDSNETAKIRVHGDGLGTVSDMINTLESLDEAYSLFILLQLIKEECKAGESASSLFRKVPDFDFFYRYRHSEYVLPNEKLVISRINFNSPGFWEFVGSLSPLVQLREYLNDRHKRKKDKALWTSEITRAELENQKLELENKQLALQNLDLSIDISLKKITAVRETLALLKDSGCSEKELREFTHSYITLFKKLEDSVEDDRITDVEIL